MSTTQNCVARYVTGQPCTDLEMEHQESTKQLKLDSTLTEPHGTGQEWCWQLLRIVISENMEINFERFLVTTCMTLDTAHKASNTMIDTGHENRLVYMASCKRRCACGHQNTPPDTDARRKVVSRRGE